MLNFKRPEAVLQPTHTPWNAAAGAAILESPCQKARSVKITMLPEFLYFDLGKVLVDFSVERMCGQMAAVAGVEPAAVQEAVFGDGLHEQYESGRAHGRPSSTSRFASGPARGRTLTPSARPATTFSRSMPRSCPWSASLPPPAIGWASSRTRARGTGSIAGGDTGFWPRTFPSMP